MILFVIIALLSFLFEAMHIGGGGGGWFKLRIMSPTEEDTEVNLRKGGGIGFSRPQNKTPHFDGDSGGGGGGVGGGLPQLHCKT